MDADGAIRDRAHDGAFEGRRALAIGEAHRYDVPDLEVGDEVTVTDAEGVVRRFVVTEVELHEKAAVPFDEVFARSGEPQLVLVTCGGDWDADRRSYRANVVVTAVPA